MRKLFLLLISLLFSISGVNAAPLDPIFDSIVAEAGESMDEDAYSESIVEMYGGKDNEQFQAMHKQFDEYKEKAAEEEAKRTTNRWLALVLSFMIALFPTCVIVKRVITGELKPADKAAVWRMVGMLLFFGIVLFALNYAWLWCLFTGQVKIMGAVLGLCLFAFVLFAIHTLRKSKKKNDTTNSPTR